MTPKKEIQVKMLIAGFLLLMMGCSGKPDFGKIKKGMRAPEVLSLVGKPERKQPMNSAEWWLYNDQDHHLVIFDSDTVSNCLTQIEAMKIMNEVLKAFDSTEKK